MIVSNQLLPVKLQRSLIQKLGPDKFSVRHNIRITYKLTAPRIFHSGGKIIINNNFCLGLQYSCDPELSIKILFIIVAIQLSCLSCLLLMYENLCSFPYACFLLSLWVAVSSVTIASSHSHVSRSLV